MNCAWLLKCFASLLTLTLYKRTGLPGGIDMKSVPEEPTEEKLKLLLKVARVWVGRSHEVIQGAVNVAFVIWMTPINWFNWNSVSKNILLCNVCQD